MTKQLFFNKQKRTFEYLSLFNEFASIMFFISKRYSDFLSLKKFFKTIILTNFDELKIILFYIAYVYHALSLFIESFIYDKVSDFKYVDKKRVAYKINISNMLKIFLTRNKLQNKNKIKIKRGNEQ